MDAKRKRKKNEPWKGEQKHRERQGVQKTTETHQEEIDR
jgi:hypothetical protein